MAGKPVQELRTKVAEQLLINFKRSGMQPMRGLLLSACFVLEKDFLKAVKLPLKKVFFLDKNNGYRYFADRCSPSISEIRSNFQFSPGC
jgi:hypothetical protein